MKTSYLRLAGQWLLVAILLFYWIKTIFFKDFFFNFEAFCPFGGLQAITTFFKNGALACSMDSMNVMMGGMLVLSTILVSKLFCGYVCPIGTFSEGLSKLGKRFRIPKYEIGGIPDMALRSLKYILLFITFYFTIGSDELYCKNYDPYFAAFTLFGVDVSTWMASLAIILLIGGAVFFRHLWCRYLCPLGAISNAFKYFYVFVVVAVIFLILKSTEFKISTIIILATISILAYVLEIIGLRKNAGMQILRITRNEKTCTSCGLCDNKCPQGIQISKMKVVNHPDCNLCTECLGSCPHEDTLGLNGSNRFNWLPALITIGFIMTGIILGTNISIPTIDVKWGSEDEIKRSAVFEMSGLKNVKCYGSSVSFVNQMKTIPGITGTATFVRDHRVQVMYDSTVMEAKDVRRRIFSPAYIPLKNPENDSTVRITDMYIDNFFDPMDLMFLSNMCETVSGIYSFQTSYGEPVKVRFYHNAGLDVDSLKSKIENLNLIYATPEERFSSKGLYAVSKVEKTGQVVSGFSLKKQTFPSYKKTFNNRSRYSNEELANLVFPIEKYPKDQQMMPYLVNHLGKGDTCIVGMVSEYTKSGPVAVVFYVKGKTNPDKIISLMQMKKLNLSYDNGVKEQIDNPFSFGLPVNDIKKE